MWRSQESERRFRDPSEGRRDRIDAASSSAPAPRPILELIGPPVTRPGFARRILGGGGAGEELEEELAPVEPAIVENLAPLFFLARPISSLKSPQS